MLFTRLFLASTRRAWYSRRDDTCPTKKEINPLNPDQAKAFLQAARSDRFEALYVLAIQCGLRQGELLGLK